MTPTIRHTQSASWLKDILCLAALFILFYTLWLGSYPLFIPDEGRYTEVAREMLATHDFITPRVDGVAFLDKPALYYWLQAISLYLFGVKEWAIRLFPALFGVIGCLATYATGRYVFNRRTGIISAIMLATSPLYFGAAHYANLDLEVAVIISCTLFLLLCAFHKRNKIRQLHVVPLASLRTQSNKQFYFFIAAYITAALAFLTKGMIGIAFPIMISGLWIALTWRWDLLKKMRLHIGIPLFLALVAPWYILVEKANPEFLHFFFVTQQVTRFLSHAEFNNKTPFWFYAPIVLAGFFPWTIFLVQTFISSIARVWHARKEHGAELFLLLWFIVIFTFFSIPHSKTIGYILPVLPSLALLTGNYLERTWQTARHTLYASGTFILVAGIFSAVLFNFPTPHWIEVLPGFTPIAKTLSFILLGGALATLITLRQKTLTSFFSVCAITSSLFLLTMLFGAPYLNSATSKPLVVNLQKIIKPTDEVASYFKFYQDVPLYLGKRITLVADWNSPTIANKDNWVRELWYAKVFQKTDDWLITENTFWQRWNSDNRMFVFVNKNYFDQFKAHASHYFRVNTYNDIILLSNQAVTTDG